MAYLLYGKKAALAIDGGAVEEILSFVNKQGLKLEFAINTHSHHDHTSGTRELLIRSGAQYLENEILREKGFVELEEEKISVYHTPGHTKDSLCFHVGNILISGDTLFNGTVGNCFSGDLDGFLKSLKLLMGLPEETVVYAGHDYVRGSLTFARYLEPGNRDIDRFLKNYDPGHVRSSLGEELKVNPYLRFNTPEMIAVLRQRGLSVKTEEDRWRSLMSIE